MAQTLKDELRNRIIIASKNEFLEKGFMNASMRTIADTADMTVGNLYRYYKSKEELYDELTKDCKKEIDNVLWYISNIRIEKETRVYDVRFDVNHVRKVVDEFAEKMVDVYKKYPVEFRMLINEWQTRDWIIAIYKDLLIKVVKQNYAVDMFEKEVDLIGYSYACAIYSGMKRIFNSKFNVTKIGEILRTFLRGFVAILDEDISKIVN